MTIVDKIVDGFPFPNITPIEGKPVYHTIEELNSQFNANVASVQSNLGGGGHSYLTLKAKLTSLATISATSLAIPVNPGPTPVIPTIQTAAQIKSLRLEHTNETFF